MPDLQQNHEEFLELSKRVFQTTDPYEANRIKNRLQQLNREYFAKALETPNIAQTRDVEQPYAPGGSPPAPLGPARINGGTTNWL